MRSCTPHVMALPASAHAGAELGAAAREVVAAPRRKLTALDGRPIL